MVKADSYFANFARFYCKNRYAFWLALILTSLFIFIARAMHTSFRCWQWRTDPLGAAILERVREKRPIPRLTGKPSAQPTTTTTPTTTTNPSTS